MDKNLCTVCGEPVERTPDAALVCKRHSIISDTYGYPKSQENRLYSKKQIEEWASKRADDAGRLSRQLLDTLRENEKLREDLEDERIHRRTCAKRVKVALEYLQAESERQNKESE